MWIRILTTRCLKVKSMDKLQQTGWTLGRVFNFRSGHLHAAYLWCFWVKWHNLNLKTRPKQCIGSLPLDNALPVKSIFGVPAIVSFFQIEPFICSKSGTFRYGPSKIGLKLMQWSEILFVATTMFQFKSFQLSRKLCSASIKKNNKRWFLFNIKFRSTNIYFRYFKEKNQNKSNLLLKIWWCLNERYNYLQTTQIGNYLPKLW
jgi:hypothetical protein